MVEAVKSVMQVIGLVAITLTVMAALVYGALWAFFNLNGFPF